MEFTKQQREYIGAIRVLKIKDKSLENTWGDEDPEGNGFSRAEFSAEIKLGLGLQAIMEFRESAQWDKYRFQDQGFLISVSIGSFMGSGVPFKDPNTGTVGLYKIEWNFGS